MSSHDRRAAGRRRAWGRGPVILKFEPLEGRQLLSVAPSGSGVDNASAETLAATTAAELAVASVDPSSPTTTLLEASNSTATNADQPSPTTTGLESSDPTTTSAEPSNLSTTSADQDGPGLIVTSAVQPKATTTSVGQPDLVAVRFMAQSNLDWDQEFTAQISVMNQGKAATEKPFTIDVYASPSLTLTAGAVKVGSLDVPAGLKPGEAFQFERRFNTPQIPIVDLTRSPSYYMLLNVDSQNEITESDESNNVNRGLQGVDASMVTVTPRQPSNLQAAGFAATPGQLQWGDKLHVKASVLNDGAGQAPPTNAWIVLSPANDTTPYSVNSYTIGTVAIPSVNGHQSVQVEQDIQLPTEPPLALSNVQNFKVSLIVDGDEVADPVVRPFQWKGQGTDLAYVSIDPKAATTPVSTLPDLEVGSVENPAAVVWGQTFTVKAKVENSGASDAGPFKVRFLLSQGNGSSGPMLALGDAEVPNLETGHGREVEQTIKLPARVPAGLSANASQARIVAVVNPDHALDESRVDNNTLNSTPISLRVVGSNGDSTPVVTLPPTPTAPQPQGKPQSPSTPPASGSENDDPGSQPAPMTRQQRLAALREARRARIQAMIEQRRANRPHNLHIYDGPAGQQHGRPMFRPRLLAIRAIQQGNGPDSGKPA